MILRKFLYIKIFLNFKKDKSKIAIVNSLRSKFPNMSDMKAVIKKLRIVIMINLRSFCKAPLVSHSLLHQHSVKAKILRGFIF